MMTFFEIMRRFREKGEESSSLQNKCVKHKWERSGFSLGILGHVTNDIKIYYGNFSFFKIG